jgi:hypothetical protein
MAGIILGACYFEEGGKGVCSCDVHLLDDSLAPDGTMLFAGDPEAEGVEETRLADILVAENDDLDPLHIRCYNLYPSAYTVSVLKYSCLL